MSVGSKCWVNIPTDVVYKLKGICAKHTLHNRRCDGCPLEEPYREEKSCRNITCGECREEYWSEEVD